MRMRSVTHALNKGMTMVELLTALAILMAVIGAVGTFQYNVLTYNRAVSNQLTNTQEAQNILKLMARELRSMTPSENGSYPIAAASTSTITFYFDIDSDGLQDQIRYYLSANKLYRGITKPVGTPATYPSNAESPSILVTGIRNSSSTPIFKYYTGSYGGSGSSMSYPLDLTRIRFIDVSLAIDTDVNKSPLSQVYSTSAALRNLKDNL